MCDTCQPGRPCSSCLVVGTLVLVAHSTSNPWVLYTPRFKSQSAWASHPLTAGLQREPSLFACFSLLRLFTPCLENATSKPGSKQTFRAFQWHLLFPCCCRVVALAVPAAVCGAAGAVSSRQDMRCRLLVAWHTQDLAQATAEPSAVPSVSGTQHHAS